VNLARHSIIDVIGSVHEAGVVTIRCDGHTRRWFDVCAISIELF
jgi:hypothetical protein